MKNVKSVKEKMKSYTPFQQKVWRTCLDIPKGQTRTYGWIASKIGNPKAARAVGSALARNPFAPIIPCHRVIKSDGGLGSYSGVGGAPRKAQLLRSEGWKGK